MKKFIKPLATGLMITVLLILVMLKVTMNFQVLLFLGSAFFFVGGMMNRGNKIHIVITIASIVLIYGVFFVLVVLNELPELWYFIPIYILSTILGIYFKRHLLPSGIASIVLIGAMSFLAIKVIPDDLLNRLTEEKYEALPEFTIYNMDGSTTESKGLKGKVVILDFFGIWCRPCIQELKELDRIKKAFEGMDVEFFVINADMGGDTPEKFDTFIKKNEYTFNFGYDHGSKIMKQLKLHHLGLPTLLIIDRDQHIRLQHVGYNQAETNFKDHIISIINELKS